MPTCLWRRARCATCPPLEPLPLLAGLAQVEGTDDPLDARVVLIGWYNEPSLFLTGVCQRVGAPWRV